MTRPGLADRAGPLTEWQEAARYYRDELGWPTGVFGAAVWIRAGHPVEALEVPVELGQRTLRWLGDAVGPVFEAPDDGGTRWVFLAAPRSADAPRPESELADVGAEHRWAGTTLDLPPSRFGAHRLRWIVPASTPVPAFAVVTAAIIEAAATP